MFCDTRVFMGIFFFLMLFSLLFYIYFNPDNYRIPLPDSASNFQQNQNSPLQHYYTNRMETEESFVQFSTHFSEETRLVYFASPTPSDCPKNIVFGRTGGGLGNIMCGYATLLAYTLHTKRTPVIDKKSFNRLNPYFEHLAIPSEVAIKRNPDCYFNYTPFNDFNLEIQSVTDFYAALKQFTSVNIKMVGRPYALNFFLQFRKELMESFQLRSKHRVGVETIVRDIKYCHDRKCTYICVHVRRTDQESWLKRKAKGRLVGKTYIYNAMKIMKSKFSDSVFLIVSDDMNWCKENLQFHEFQIEFIGNMNRKNPITDLGLLMYTNHSILTHGTFGFIGAFLSGGHVIQPTNFSQISPGPQVAGKKLKNWIQIDGF